MDLLIEQPPEDFTFIQRLKVSFPSPMLVWNITLAGLYDTPHSDSVDVRKTILSSSIMFFFYRATAIVSFDRMKLRFDDAALSSLVK